jgi:hypothetical protein
MKSISQIRFTVFSELRRMGYVLMKKWFIVIACLWASQAFGQQTYKAASCNQADVQAAINNEIAHSVDGDIISIPAGTCTWSAVVSGNFTTSVTIQGAGAISATQGGASTTGTDQTIIIDEVNHSSAGGSSLVLTVASGKMLRFTGIAVKEDANSTAPTGIVQINGSGQARVDHCHFYMTIGANELFFRTYGVDDHNFFESTGGNGGIYYERSNTDLGDAEWNAADRWGTANFFYTEDNLFSDHSFGDSHDGARYVLRHNTVTSTTSHGAAQVNHGTHDQGRSMRAAEVYLNNITNANSTGSGGPVFSNNGGTTLFWGNTIGVYRYGIQLDYTCKSTATYAECGSAPPSGWGLCNATTGDGWDQNQARPNGYPCIDQPGRGQGDLLGGGNFPNRCNITQNPACNIFTGIWPTETLSPIYIWSNTISVCCYSDATLVADNYSPLIENNRDFFMQFGANANPGSFNGTAGVGSGTVDPTVAGAYSGAPNCSNATYPGPGYWNTTTNTLWVCTAANTWNVYYTPYTYPHPLTQSTSATTSTPAVAPPTGLQAVVN